MANEKEEMTCKNKEMKLMNEELVRINSKYNEELESIRTSRSWIYLSRLKKIFGK